MNGGCSMIRRNHRTGEVPHDAAPLGDPNGGRKPINAKCETVRDLSSAPLDASVSERCAAAKVSARRRCTARATKSRTA